MKIILVVTDSRRKNVVFVSDGLQALSLAEAIVAARRDEIEGASVVERETGAYLRTKPSVSKNEEFETLSCTGSHLLSYARDARHAASTPALSEYTKRYFASLEEGQAFIEPVGKSKFLSALTADVKSKLTKHRDTIAQAAKEFSVDPYLLGAILVDEIARLLPFENITDALQARFLGMDASIGIAQVTVKTANDLIRKGVYHPNPDDARLPYIKSTRKNFEHLYAYLIQPKYSIRFAAAFIRYVTDFWSPHVDLSERPEIVGTLYHLGYGIPKKDPKPDERGLQIAGDFYPRARKWLNEQ